MRRKHASQKGASLVEFALVLPLLLLILFGIIEFAIMLYDKEMITNASREGARRGIVYRVDSAGNYSPFTEQEIKAILEPYLKDHLITLRGTSIPVISAIATPSAASGNMLSVQVTYTYNFLVLKPIAELMGGGALPGSVTLNAVTKMRME